MWFRFCAGPGFSWRLYLSVVTKMAPVGARRLRWEVHICLSTEPRQPGGCKLKTAPVRPVVAARPAEYVCSEDLFY
ncbi:hypothetical protein FQH35_24765 [Escherichia coli]|nr:hypothetical protein [Escherichia coli]